MKILDAMACGLPVVTPLFGGPTAYCRTGQLLSGRLRAGPGRRLSRHAVAARLRTIRCGPRCDAASLGRADARRCSPIADRAAAVGATDRSPVIERLHLGRAPRERLVDDRVRAAERARVPRRAAGTAGPRRRPERSPYWLGLRISVVIPTHNRKDKLLACLDALRAAVDSAAGVRGHRRRRWVDGWHRGGGRQRGRSRSACAICDRSQSGPGAARNLGDRAGRRRAGAVHRRRHSRRPTAAGGAPAGARRVGPSRGDGVLGPHRLAGCDDARTRSWTTSAATRCCSSPIR